MRKLFSSVAFLAALSLASLSNCSNFESQNANDERWLTIGTFNIEWLGDGVGDKFPRSSEDYKRIAQVIEKIDPEIIGLEEIENADAIEKILDYLPESEYDYFIKPVSGSQNVALLYKKSVSITNPRYYYPLAVVPYKTRPALIAEAKFKNFDFIIVAVHLKSTSRYDSSQYLKEKSRQIRNEQAQILASLADSIISKTLEKDVIIVGDFNDYPTRKTDPTLIPLSKDPNLDFLTAGMQSCKYSYWKSIDHIVVSKSAEKRYVEGSVFMYNSYDSFPENEAQKISDHCPVIAEFDPSAPDND